jgi:hypothetical protein
LYAEGKNLSRRLCDDRKLTGVLSEGSKESAFGCASFSIDHFPSLIPREIPVILESRVEESEIDQEMQNALNALSTKQLAFVGD